MLNSSPSDSFSVKLKSRLIDSILILTQQKLDFSTHSTKPKTTKNINTKEHWRNNQINKPTTKPKIQANPQQNQQTHNKINKPKQTHNKINKPKHLINAVIVAQMLTWNLEIKLSSYSSSSSSLILILLGICFLKFFDRGVPLLRSNPPSSLSDSSSSSSSFFFLLLLLHLVRFFFLQY